MIQFPVAVTLPDGTFHKPAKAYSHEGVTDLYVWDRTSQAAALVGSFPGELEPAGFRQWTIANDGAPIAVAATGGCGCGHPLKRWAPPRPVVG